METTRIAEANENYYALELMGTIDIDYDVDEILGGSHPDGVTYTEMPYRESTYTVTGFRFYHPNGAFISGNLPEPVMGYRIVEDEHEVLDSEDCEDKVRAAILKQLGNIDVPENLAYDLAYVEA